MRTKLHELAEIGQSVWCDNLSRRIIESGELQRLIDLGVAGVTSNPTIFMKAITGSADYDDAIHAGIDGGVADSAALYERLAIPDVADAADLLRPVYDRTSGVDGYVSLEVNPRLADDTQGTIAEARRLFGELDRPNVLIKVPATDAGVPAIDTLIGEGINVNVTLIFSVAVHKRVMEAYLAGLRKLNAIGGDLSRVASVASFFVSRVDTAVDKMIEKRHGETTGVDRFLGKAAIANADLAYARFREFFDPSGPFGELKNRGARVQRPLWASTSTKNPAYADTLYVDNLIAPDTVNTMPPETIEATLDHGRVGAQLGSHLDQSRELLAKLAEAGIDLKAVTDQLTIEGVKSFAKSFDELLSGLSQKQSTVRASG
ncbi:MAG: transaldolase [Phycisphaerales bacterium]|nr:transaldolase [Phycisphaerales bacterium]